MMNSRLYNIARQWADPLMDKRTHLLEFELENNPHFRRRKGHIIRESIYYAIGLLHSEHPGDWEAAEAVVDAVLQTQQLDSEHPNVGGFPYCSEEPWGVWDVPDVNWTQFVGMALAYVLDIAKPANRLTYDCIQRVERGFRCAVQGTLDRDVGAAYTNIALLSSAVAAAGGEMAFAKRKLTEIRQHWTGYDLPEEYLSPTYYGVNLSALYSTLHFSENQELSALAQELIERLWCQIETAYHAPTGQLCGPHSRAYGTNIYDYACLLKFFLFLAGDKELPFAEPDVDHRHDLASLFIIGQHPVEPRPEMFALRPGQKKLTTADGRVATQYHADTYCLGSISNQDEWSQRNNVVIYSGGRRKPAWVRGGLIADKERAVKTKFQSQQIDNVVAVEVKSGKGYKGYELRFKGFRQCSSDRENLYIFKNASGTVVYLFASDLRQDMPMVDGTALVVHVDAVKDTPVRFVLVVEGPAQEPPSVKEHSGGFEVRCKDELYPFSFS